jgi:hypothetical protein
MKTLRRLKPPASARAFTLIEVMLAISILRTSGPTAGMVAGQFFVTNKIEEGGNAGDFSDIAGYEGYTWRSQALEVATNGLFKMEIAVFDPHGNQSSILNVLLYKPDSGNGQKLGLQPQPH